MFRTAIGVAAFALAAIFAANGVATAKDAKPNAVRVEERKPPTKPPSIVWDRDPGHYDNPVGGGFCRETADSCRPCGDDDMTRATYRESRRNGRDRYAYICCNADDAPVIRSASGVGIYGVCHICGSGSIRMSARPEHREHGRTACYRCRRSGYEWRPHHGATVCLSCGSDYDYDEDSSVCRLKGPRRPERPERQRRLMR